MWRLNLCWLMQDPERVVHAPVPIIGVAGPMLMGDQRRELFVTRKNHVASASESGTISATGAPVRRLGVLPAAFFDQTYHCGFTV
jgi:hypothetical protein